MKILLLECIILILTISSGVGRVFLIEAPRKYHHLEGKIVGGENTTIEQFPYQVSLEDSVGHYCGGAIISPDIIITAKHCVSDPEQKLVVRAGTTNREKGGTVHEIKNIIRHNGSNVNFDYDVALLVLKTPLEYSHKIQPISLPEESENLNDNELVTVTGWGYLHPGGVYLPQILQKVEIPIVNQSKCVQAYSLIGIVTPNMLCAGLYGIGGKDACQGDSGGPLAANDKLYGITSWGYGCADSNYPGVFVRISSIREWIRLHAHI